MEPKAIAELCEVMLRYGLTSLTAGPVTLTRPSHMVMPDAMPTRDKMPADDDHEPMTLEAFGELTAEQQERILSAGLRGGGR